MSSNLPFATPTVITLPPLLNAAWQGDSTRLRQALARPRSNINQVDAQRRTALRWAVEYRHVDVVAALLAVPGIEVDLADVYAWKPLHTLWSALPRRVWDGPYRIATMLAEAGCNLDAVDYRGLTTRALCRAAGNFDMADALKALGARG